MPKWHTLRPPQSLLTPPFPLRIPTVPPPCPLPMPELTLSVPFWHSSGCPGPWKAGGDCEATGRSCANLISLTYKGGKGPFPPHFRPLVKERVVVLIRG